MSIIAWSGVACRVGFDPQVPGLADGVTGVPLSMPGALVLEDGRYDAAPSLDGAGFAVTWVEYPPAGHTPQLRFTIVAEDSTSVVPPLTIENLLDNPVFVRLWTGPDGYLVVYAMDAYVIFLALDSEGTIVNRREDTSRRYDSIEAAATDDGFVIAYLLTRAFGDPPTYYYPELQTMAIDNDGRHVFGPTVIDPQVGISQEAPAIARVGSELAIAWVDLRGGPTNPRLRFRHVDARGEPTPSPSIPIYDTGESQGRPHLVKDGTDGLLLAYDGYDTFPQYLLRITADGVPTWDSPAQIYDEPLYHYTLDVAGSASGRAGFAWVTEFHTTLTNIEVTSVDGNVGATPSVPAPMLLTVPTYAFCYPEVARASTSLGVVFAGEVEGSLRLYLVILPD